MITIDELKVLLDNKSRLLGVDMGAKRIGISVCDENRKIATPYETIQFKNIKNLTSSLQKIISEFGYISFIFMGRKIFVIPIPIKPFYYLRNYVIWIFNHVLIVIVVYVFVKFRLIFLHSFKVVNV